jgi:hypothetical protein
LPLVIDVPVQSQESERSKMYLCVRSIDFAPFNDFLLDFGTVPKV